MSRAIRISKAYSSLTATAWRIRTLGPALSCLATILARRGSSSPCQWHRHKDHCTRAPLGHRCKIWLLRAPSKGKVPCRPRHEWLSSSRCSVWGTSAGTAITHSSSARRSRAESTCARLEESVEASEHVKSKSCHPSTDRNHRVDSDSKIGGNFWIGKQKLQRD